MDTYIVYVGMGNVLGAAEAEELNQAAEAVVNEVEWPDDTVAAKVNVARVTDPDYEVGDTIDTSHEAIEVEEINLKVAVHD